VNLDGTAVLHADRERVWSVITDPAVLARTIPGCLSLEQVGDDEYRMNVSVGVGAIKGTYAGEVRLSDQKRPDSYVMHASGAGGPGQVKAVVAIELEDESVPGQTTLTYSADAVVGGPVAGVGQRMISGVAKRMAMQFFSAIDDELERQVSVAIDEELGVPSVVPIGSAPSAMAASTDGPPRVFAGRAAAPAGEVNLREVALGAIGGAALSLIGVAVGYVLGRRFTYWR
jgi:carbon monoxide dehydrogenase subunit G